MKISNTGLNLIKTFEGCYLKAYRCPAGVLTIGYGCTVGVKEGQTITQDQADRMLLAELSRFEKAVNNLGVEFNQNQFDALVSFAYNLGAGIFKGSLLTAIKSKDWTSVASQMLLYNKARVNGKLTVLKGLDRRRKAEVELFKKGCGDEVVKKIKIVLNGVTKEVNAIEKDGVNFVKLRDLQDNKIAIGYNGKPTVTVKG